MIGARTHDLDFGLRELRELPAGPLVYCNRSAHRLAFS
jgi:hypothetical protein